ncbi:response regulator [Winogradskyella litorisediminis]|uniref:Response regulator n=1 Tax=Winogradskyella litorisediminis TaxID=1156618 RepID=A0ABW3N6I9_9FLAO
MLNVFLVDDDEDDRLFFQEAIEEVNVDVTLSLYNNGQDVMDYLYKSDSTLPELIFLDLNMPIKNGMECLREIKTNPRLKNIIVAIYSTSSSEEDIERTFINGANIYINKPTNFAALKNAIAKVVKLNWQYHTSNLNRETFLYRI